MTSSFIRYMHKNDLIYQRILSMMILVKVWNLGAYTIRQRVAFLWNWLHSDVPLLSYQDINSHGAYPNSILPPRVSI